MIRRIERDPVAPGRKLGVAKRAQGLVPVLEDRRAPELALRYSNGFVTVEITHDALDAYVEEFGDVPLPVQVDRETGDRRTYDARTKVRVVYDRDARLREITTRGRDGIFVRLTVLAESAGTQPGGHEALGDVADQERNDAQGDGAAEPEAHAEGQPQGAGDEDDGGAEEDGQEAAPVAAGEAALVERADGVGGEREADQIACRRGERAEEARDAAHVAGEDR